MTESQGDRDAPSILLWGARSKARIAADMVRELDIGAVHTLFDPTVSAPEFSTSAHFTSDVAELSARLAGMTHFVVCIGGAHGYARVMTARALERLGLRALDLIHPHAYVDATAELGHGAQCMPSSTVHKFVSVGEQCVINTNATIDHECEVGNGVHVMGGAALAGQVRVGDYATIGTNATVCPGLEIGEGAFVGAGAVVISDVPPRVVVAGNPARRLREHELQYDGQVVDALLNAVAPVLDVP